MRLIVADSSSLRLGGVLIVLTLWAIPTAALAADSSDAGCQALVSAAATGMANQIKADDATIKQPQSISKFTCLGDIFGGLGLNVLTNGLNIGDLAQSAMGKVCTQLTSAWDNLKGSAQCGMTVTGLNTNFGLGSLGSGNFCPSLNFGGGGDALITAGTNTNGSSSWDAQGSTQLPTGYELDLAGPSTGYSHMPGN